MSSYFIGNVLPDTNQPGENDPTFDFKHSEASSMSLKGIPIRIEHSDKLQVGTVTRDWSSKDGKKWVVGRLDHSTVDGNYAGKSIRPSKKSGHTLYTGLSLKHAYRRYADGREVKAPVEVSLCTKPRRPNCKIYKTSKPKTKKNDYIVHCASTKIMSSETPQQTNEQQNTQETVVETAPTTSVETTEEVAQAPNQETLMQLVVDQESENQKITQQFQDAQSQLKAVQEKLAKLEEERKAAESLKEQEIKTKAENLGEALAESLQKNVDVSEDVKKAIDTLAKGNPAEASKVFEIMHCASAKYQEQLTESTKQVLAKQCRDIVSRKRVITETAPVQEVVHAASKKHKPNPFEVNDYKPSNAMQSVRERNPHLFAAFKNYSRSGASLMHEIAQIGRN
tara:strand:+ start:2064 stop:3248 length:1185 start_codon:yes stop_codon:yes gene_type:complete